MVGTPSRPSPTQGRATQRIAANATGCRRRVSAPTVRQHAAGIAAAGDGVSRTRRTNNARRGPADAVIPSVARPATTVAGDELAAAAAFQRNRLNRPVGIGIIELQFLTTNFRSIGIGAAGIGLFLA